MNSERIKEIQAQTGYPESHSVQQALNQVWNECTQDNTVMCNGIVKEHQNKIDDLEKEVTGINSIINVQHDYIKTIENKCIHILKPVDCNECAGYTYSNNCISCKHGNKTDNFIQKECAHIWETFIISQTRTCTTCGLKQTAKWENENAD